MCRRKPGPRCHKHSRAHLDATTQRMETAALRVKAATNPMARQAAEEVLRERIIEHAWAQREFDGTRTGAEAVRAAMAEAEPGSDVHKRLEGRLQAAGALREARREHARMMPPPPGAEATSGQTTAYNNLGRAREDLARWDSADVLGEHTDADAAAKTRQQLDTRVYTADVTYRASSKVADLANLDPDEVAAIATAPQALADRIVFASHARAAFRTGHHGEHLAQALASQDKQLSNDIAEHQRAVEASQRVQGRYADQSAKRRAATYPEPGTRQGSTDAATARRRRAALMGLSRLLRGGSTTSIIPEVLMDDGPGPSGPVIGEGLLVK